MKRHYGAVAEDFQAACGLGDGEHLTTVALSGVTMAAIQGLHEVVREKDTELAELRADNEALQERLEALEKLVRSLTSCASVE